MYEELIIRKLALSTSLIRSKKFSFIDTIKEKEIVVWIRLQKDCDKIQILDFIQHKFHLEPERAEKLYYHALPVGLSNEELVKIKEINEKLEQKDMSLEEIDLLLDNTINNIQITNNTNIVSEIANIIL